MKDLDHALVRHFVGLTLVVAQPPYSPVFAGAMAALLRENVVSKALRSSLDESHCRALVAFIEGCARPGPEDGSEDDSNGMDVVRPEDDERRDGGEGSFTALLDPAMRKGLNLVYSHLLKK